MKKIISILLCVFVTLSLIGCTNEKVSKIYPAELTEDEENILKLVGVESDIDIYKFEIDDTYKTVSFWIETYNNGELMSSPSRMDSQVDSSEGKIAIVVDKTSNYNWRITYQHASGLSSYSFETKNSFETSDEYSIGSGGLNEPIEIIPEDEIVLDVFLFEDGNNMSVYDNQYYVENRNVLKQYDYVYLVKCKFSKKTVNEINNEK